MQNTYRLSQKAKQLEDDSSKGILGLSQEEGGGVNHIFFHSSPLLVRDLENNDISLYVTQISS